MNHRSNKRGAKDFRSRLESLGVLKKAETICKKAGTTIEEVYGSERKLHVCRARNELMRLIRGTFQWSYPAIGELFGGRDHTTVIANIESATR
jgi:chromosomal replication initiation ATPase DnaA